MIDQLDWEKIDLINLINQSKIMLTKVKLSKKELDLCLQQWREFTGDEEIVEIDAKKGALIREGPSMDTRALTKENTVCSSPFLDQTGTSLLE